MTELLNWVALNFTGVPNKEVTVCILYIFENIKRSFNKGHGRSLVPAQKTTKLGFFKFK